MGTGSVGQAYASKFITLGYDVMIGTRNLAEKSAVTAKDGYGNPPFSEWHSANKTVKLGTFKQAAFFGDMILNATMGHLTIKL